MSLLYTLIRFLLVFLIFSFLLENGMRSVFFFCPTCFYLLIYLLLGFCGGSDGKESTCNAGDLSLIPRSWIFPGEGNGNPLHYSCLRNSMDRGAWGLQSMGLQRVRHDWAPKHSTQHSNEKCCKVLVSSNGGVTSIRQALPQITAKNSGKKIFFNYLKTLESHEKQAEIGVQPTFGRRDWH